MTKVAPPSRKRKQGVSESDDYTEVSVYYSEYEYYDESDEGEGDSNLKAIQEDTEENTTLTETDPK